MIYKAQQTRFFVNLGHFLPFHPDTQKTKFLKIGKKTPGYYHFTHAHHKWQSHDVWFLRYGAQPTEFVVMLDRFLLFYPLTTQKIKILKTWKKKKKTLGDIIILHMSTINNNHMMNGSWDIECHRLNFLSFWTNFLPFYPLTTQKIKILKKEKKNLQM